MAKVMILANQKGGVGKTTTSVNLAYTLAEMGKKTLLVDFDPQANTTKGLGITKEVIKTSIADLMALEIKGEDLPDKEDFIMKIDNLDVIPSTIALSGIGVELDISAMFKEKVLSDIIDTYKEDYEYIIIDTNPSLGIITINALVAADSIIIPVDASEEALDGFSDLLSTIKKIKKRINQKLEIEGILITKYQKNTTNDREVLEEIKDACTGVIDVFNTIIPYNAKVKEAYKNRKPVVCYKRSATGSLAYKEFTKELLAKLEK